MLGEWVSASGGKVGAMFDSGRRGSRRADVDAVIEGQLPHELHERRDRLQVSLLKRSVGQAQRLGQPRDLRRVVLGEPPRRQGLTDSAADSRRTLFRVARDLLDAVARNEQVEIRLASLDQSLAEDFARGALARSFGDQFHLVAHERSRSANLDQSYF